jgi:hypothetical protein
MLFRADQDARYHARSAPARLRVRRPPRETHDTLAANVATTAVALGGLTQQVCGLTSIASHCQRAWAIPPLSEIGSDITALATFRNAL